MKKGKSSPERLLEEIVELEPVQFLGVCKILGIELYRTDDEGAPAEEGTKDFSELWADVCDTIGSMNRTRRRNLSRLIYAATKGKEEKE